MLRHPIFWDMIINGGLNVNIIHNRKGLSPIFASLLILAVVTALFIPVFFWSTGITTETQSFWELSGLIATERISIEEVNLKATVTSCTIYVRNLGKTAVIIENVFISLAASTLYTYRTSQFTTDVPSIIQGDLITISINTLGFTPLANATYTIQVFSTRGVGDSFQVVA
jgi:flagellin-like protein